MRDDIKVPPGSYECVSSYMGHIDIAPSPSKTLRAHSAEDKWRATPTRSRSLPVNCGNAKSNVLSPVAAHSRSPSSVQYTLSPPTNRSAVEAMRKTREQEIMEVKSLPSYSD